MDDKKQLLNQMVDSQIEPRHEVSDKVVRVMRSVPRDRFVPDEILDQAFANYPLPIACGQTISQPYMVALMAELLELEGNEKVLEVGAGCGYQAAVLAELAAEVFAVEWHPPLAREAETKLRELGYTNVMVRQGDGKLGWKEGGPFDRIVVSCALHSAPPIAWDEQLRPGGILLFPQASGSEQWLQRWRKLGADHWEKEKLFGVRFVPLL